MTKPDPNDPGAVLRGKISTARRALNNLLERYDTARVIRNPSYWALRSELATLEQELRWSEAN